MTSRNLLTSLSGSLNQAEDRIALHSLRVELFGRDRHGGLVFCGVGLRLQHLSDRGVAGDFHNSYPVDGVVKTSRSS